MAREHARIWISIWDDPDFLSLPSAHQRMYFGLMSNEDINYAGVAPLLPGRLAAKAPDLTERKVVSAIDALAEARFLVVDKGTSEVLVRTFIRHDGILKQPNVVKAMNKAWAKVYSDAIRGAIYEELPKALAHTFPEGIPQGVCKAIAEGFGEPLVEGFREHFANSPSPFPLPPSFSVVTSNSNVQSVSRGSRGIGFGGDAA